MPFEIPTLPFSGTGDMATDIKNATAMVQLWKKGLQGTAEKNIHEANAVVPDGNYMVPAEIIANCHGIAFLFFVKAGFIFSGELGTGFVIHRLNKDAGGERWSAPSAITSGGMGWGLQAGAQKTYNAVFLQSEQAVKVFGDKAKVNFGGDFGISAGPVGRNLDVKGTVGTGGVAMSYSYSYSRGLYAGIALNGAIAAANPVMNKTFYGQEVDARNLLQGEVGLNHSVCKTPELDLLYQEMDELIAAARQRLADDKQTLLS